MQAVQSQHNTSFSTCQSCTARQRCLGRGLSDNSLARLVQCGHVAQSFAKGRLLFRAGDAPSRLYCVKSGTVKTYRITAGGEQQVTGFYFAGMVFGLSDLAQTQRDEYAEALDNSQVCSFAMTEVNALFAQDSKMLANLMLQCSAQMRLQQLLNSYTDAEARLRYYLSCIQESLSRPGLPVKGFALSMTNKDLANFLQLRPETLSRLFNHLKAEGDIAMSGRQLTLGASLPVAA